MTGSRPPGVPARTLRRIALTVVLLGAVGLGFFDRYVGFDAVPAAILLVLAYGTLVAVPIQLLYRELRLQPAGVVVFAGTVLALVGAFWCDPIVRNEFLPDTTYVVAVRAVAGRPELSVDQIGPWQTAAAVCAVLAVLGCMSLCALTLHLQRVTRGRAVNPAMTRSILATFATLPEPQGGTSVTRPAEQPDYFGRSAGR